MTALDWETADLSALSEENIWDLLGSAMAEEQEIAQFAWDASGKLHRGTGFHSINEMINKPEAKMPPRSKLHFYRRKIAELRNQAAR